MSVEEQKLIIEYEFRKFCGQQTIGISPCLDNCPNCRIDWYIDRLATSEEKVKQLSAELKIAERQIKELIRKIK